MDFFHALLAASQMDDNWTLMKEGQAGTPSRGDWLVNFLEPGATIGVDPFLMPVSEWNNLNKSLDGSNMKLVGVSNNLVDMVWGSSQPDRPNQPIIPLEFKFTGNMYMFFTYATYTFSRFLVPFLRSLTISQRICKLGYIHTYVCSLSIN